MSLSLTVRKSRPTHGQASRRYRWSTIGTVGRSTRKCGGFVKFAPVGQKSGMRICGLWYNSGGVAHTFVGQTGRRRTDGCIVRSPARRRILMGTMKENHPEKAGARAQQRTSQRRLAIGRLIATYRDQIAAPRVARRN